MITFLNGVLFQKQPTRVVIDVQGIGYEVFIPLSSYDRLPPVQAELRLLTYEHIREDLHELYGFAAEEERAMFLKLISVSGIGPKLALGALSGLNVRDLVTAIAEGDVKRLTTVPGLGKRTAERLVVELRDKFAPEEVMSAASAGARGAGADRRLRDAVLALISLGYKEAQAAKLVGEVSQQPESSDLSTEEIIKKALSD